MNKFLAVIAVSVAALSSQASYLWWEVNSNNSDMSAVSSWISEGEGHSWDTAIVYAYDGTDKSTATQIGSSSAANLNGPIVAWGGSIDLSTVSGASGYSYYIELVNSSTSQVVGYSATPTAYADLSGSITETLSDMPKVTVWHGGSSYKAAPEPTSALLMLLGVAGLALKRKQRNVNEV